MGNIDNGHLVWVWRTCFVTLLIVSMGLSLLSVGGEMWFSGQDKVAHTVTYGALYVLGWLSFPGPVLRWSLFVSLLGYGILIEVLQHFSAYRFMEFWDVVANTLGLGLGSFGIFLWRSPH